MAGKTSLAEAIYLFNGRYAPTRLWNSQVRRSQCSVDPLARRAGGSVELAGTERGTRHEWKAVFERIPTLGGRTADSGNGSWWTAPPRGRLRMWLDGEEAGGGHLAAGNAPGTGVFVLPVIHAPAGHGGAAIYLPSSPIDSDEQTIRRFSAPVLRRCSALSSRSTASRADSS